MLLVDTPTQVPVQKVKGATQKNANPDDIAAEIARLQALQAERMKAAEGSLVFFYFDFIFDSPQFPRTCQQP